MSDESTTVPHSEVPSGQVTFGQTGARFSESERIEITARAWDLSLSGMSNRAIGHQLGISHTQVGRYLDSYQTEFVRNSVEVAQRKEEERLEMAYSALVKVIADDQGSLCPHCHRGPTSPRTKVEAINAWRQIGDSVRRMLGLDAASQVQINVTRDKSAEEIELERLVAEVKARNKNIDSQLRRDSIDPGSSGGDGSGTQEQA